MTIKSSGRAGRKVGMAGCLLAALLLPGAAWTGISVDWETGVVWTGRNDQAIPGTVGTRFSLVNDLDTPVQPAFRVRAGWAPGERHHVGALFAPLRATARGTLERDVLFAGRLFPAGTPVAAVYRFDSYRVTWRYLAVRRGGWEFWAGLTGKVRDAEVTLVGGGEASKLNTGFVPLVNIRLSWKGDGSPAGFLLDADALAGPQGRAEDALAALTWSLRDGLTGRLGYRMLEGGADVDEVYNFAWLHFAVAGIEAEF